MLAKPIVAAALLAAGGLAFAEDITIARDAAFASTLARPELRAQVAQARRAHQLPSAGEAYVYDAGAAPAPARARAEVKREARDFARRHDIDPNYLPG